MDTNLLCFVGFKNGREILYSFEESIKSEAKRLALIWAIMLSNKYENVIGRHRFSLRRYFASIISMWYHHICAECFIPVHCVLSIFR